MTPGERARKKRQKKARKARKREAAKLEGSASMGYHGHSVKRFLLGDRDDDL